MINNFSIIVNKNKSREFPFVARARVGGANATPLILPRLFFLLSFSIYKNFSATKPKQTGKKWRGFEGEEIFCPSALPRVARHGVGSGSLCVSKEAKPVKIIPF